MITLNAVNMQYIKSELCVSYDLNMSFLLVSEKLIGDKKMGEFFNKVTNYAFYMSLICVYKLLIYIC